MREAKNAKLDYTYIVVSGIVVEGAISMIKRKFRLVSFDTPRESHEVISYLDKTGWFRDDKDKVKWVEVYRASLMGGSKEERAVSLDTLFKTEGERLEA
jgi:hypothetical protein